MADGKRQNSQCRGTAPLRNVRENKSESSQSVTWYIIEKNEVHKSKLPTEICQWLEASYLEGKSSAIFECEKTRCKYTACLGKENKLSVDKEPFKQLERVSVEEDQTNGTKSEASASAQLPHTPDKNESNPTAVVLQSSVQMGHSTADPVPVDDITNKFGGMTLTEDTSKIKYGSGSSDHARALGNKASIVKSNKNEQPARNERSHNQALNSVTGFSQCSEKTTNVPTNAESKTVSNTPSVALYQGYRPQNKGNMQTPKPDADYVTCTGPKAVVASPGIPVGNTTVSYSNLGARPKETRLPEVEMEQKENGALSTEEQWNKIPVLNKKDVMICHRRTTCVLFPSNDVDMDECIFFQLLFLGQHSWSKYFINFIKQKQFSISEEDIRISGKNVQHIIVKTGHKIVDIYKMIYELVQECGIRVRLFNKNSSECEHIQQEPLPALVENCSVDIFRNFQGDKLVLIGREPDLKEIMKVYGLNSIEGKGYIYGESLEVSYHDVFLFTNLNLSKFLQFDKCHINCLVTKGIKKDILIYAGMSLRQMREAIESTMGFLAKVPCDMLHLSPEKMSLLEQNESQSFVAKMIKQKVADCALFVQNENFKIVAVTEDKIKSANSEIDRCIHQHVLPINVWQILFEQELNISGKFKILANDEKLCTVVCTSDVSYKILDIINSYATECLDMSVSEIEWGFICRHYDEDMTRIKEKYDVKITAVNNGLQVEGKSGINKEELQKEIGQLLPKRTNNVPVDPSLKEFVLSEEGKESLIQLAADNKTMYDINVGDVGACDNLLCSWYFENVSQQILLVQGRAADLHVDCLVIPVNDRMVPLTPTEHGIQESFDEEMKKEVEDKYRAHGQYMECSNWIEGKKKGKLKCNKLLVYLTVRNMQNMINDAELQDGLKDIFLRADSCDLESVGLPVEYLYGLSQNKITTMLGTAVEAASIFFKCGGQNLKKVYLCTMEKLDIDSKISEVEKTLEQTKTATLKSVKTRGIKSFLGFANEEIKTKVMVCSIDQAKVDVIVNTLSKSLDFEKGMVSKKIKAIAGQGIEDELKRKYPGGIKSLEIAVSEPYSLKKIGFKKVFHVAVDDLGTNIKEKIMILKVLTAKCLEVADELQMSSVAFPALGTGGLEYPFRDVAWAMFEAIDEFQPVGKKHHLKKVKFVLFEKDVETIKAFLKEEQRRKEKSDHGVTRPIVGKVPELLHGRINSKKRPEFNIVIESEYPVPSFALEVVIKVQKGSKGILKCCDREADLSNGAWNDLYLIETSDEEEMFKKGIEVCLSYSSANRITHLLFHMCLGSSMSACDQVHCITSVIVQNEQRYLQSVIISVPSSSEFANIKGTVEAKNSKTLLQSLKSIMTRDSPQVSWTSSYLPVKPSEMTIILRSNTKDHLQCASKAIIEKLKMQMTIKPMEIDSVFAKGTAQLNTAIVKNLKENGLLSEWMKNIKEQHEFQVTENTHGVKITGQAGKLFSEEWLHKSLDTSCIKIEMDEDEYVLLHETEFFSKYVKSQSYSRPVMIITCKREKCNEIQNTFDERLQSLRMNGKHEIRLENTLEISKVREYVKSLHVDCIVRIGDELGIVVVMWTTYEEYLKQKHKLLNVLGLLDTTKDSRKKRQYRTDEVVSVTEKETYAVNKTNLPVDSQLGAVFETAEGLIVRVYKGDITQVTVDCIVNAANEHLANAAGVAKAIEDKAGKEFSKECQNSVSIYGPLNVGEARVCTAGDLKCKVIINAVGPRWGSYRDKMECLAVLRDTVRSCLELSNGSNHETIALPSISAGIFGVPLDLCAEEYCQAIISFSKETTTDLIYLKEVHFVDIKQDTLDVIHSTFSKWLKSSSGIPSFCTTPSSSDKDSSSLLSNSQTRAESALANSVHFMSLGNVSNVQQQQLMHQQPAIREGAEKQYKAEMTQPGSSILPKGIPAQVAGGDLNKNLQQRGAGNQYTTNQAEMTQSMSLTKQTGMVSFKTMSHMGIPAQFEVFTASNRKLKINVVHADITAVSVDAIVSTEDKLLSGKGAVASAVKKVAGDEFAKTLEQLCSKSSLNLCDVVITGVGGLPCKFVLHAVSPHWDKDAVKNNKKFEADVSLTLFNVLKMAEENKLESVAVPFLGTSDDEQHRPTPVDTCARGMIQGLMDYIQFKPSSNIAHVLFVSSDVLIVQGIMDALQVKSSNVATLGLVYGKISPCQPTGGIIHQ